MHTTDVYRATRERITDLLRTAPDDAADRPVPGCPSWTVRQLACHLSGVVADALAGNLADAGEPHWTAAQVEARADRSLGQVLDEWSEQGRLLEAALGPDGAPDQLVFDTTTHEHDLRAALGRPAVDADAVAVSMRFIADRMPEAMAERGLPELRIEPTDGGPAITIGSVAVSPDGEPGTVRGTSFDLFRSLSGRRSSTQIAALEWHGEPATWMPAFTWGPFQVPAEPVEPGPATFVG
jgi:uncharacterized protein (TIGR03083 family)